MASFPYSVKKKKIFAELAFWRLCFLISLSVARTWYFPLPRSKALIYSFERETEGQFTFFLSSCGSHLLYTDVLGGSGVVAK